MFLVFSVLWVFFSHHSSCRRFGYSRELNGGFSFGKGLSLLVKNTNKGAKAFVRVLILPAGLGAKLCRWTGR